MEIDNPFLSLAPPVFQAQVGEVWELEWEVSSAYSNNDTLSSRGEIVSNERGWIHLKNSVNENLHLPLSMVSYASKQEEIVSNPFMNL